MGCFFRNPGCALVMTLRAGELLVAHVDSCPRVRVILGVPSISSLSRDPSLQETIKNPGEAAGF